MIQITPSLQINDSELQFDYVRASGPGGQNVNKVATAVQLRFDINSSSLPKSIQQRLLKISGKKATNQGILILEAKRFRTQEQNREDAIRRFVELVRKSMIKPKKRINTIPTKLSRERRIRAKKERAEIKKNRQNWPFE
jgi:ribosome-associated protein